MANAWPSRHPLLRSCSRFFLSGGFCSFGDFLAFSLDLGVGIVLLLRLLLLLLRHALPILNPESLGPRCWTDVAEHG